LQNLDSPWVDQVLLVFDHEEGKPLLLDRGTSIQLTKNLIPEMAS
jgi:hypothetical protein